MDVSVGAGVWVAVGASVGLGVCVGVFIFGAAGVSVDPSISVGFDIGGLIVIDNVTTPVDSA
jgi:hypothetical protein